MIPISPEQEWVLSILKGMDLDERLERLKELREKQREENRMVEGARPDETVIDDIQWSKDQKLLKVFIRLLFYGIFFLCGYWLGLSKLEKMSDEYGALFDRQEKLIQGFLSDRSRAPFMKVVFPGELTLSSKLVLMKELNTLALEELEESPEETLNHLEALDYSKGVEE